MKFSEFVKQDQQASGIVIDGTFQCQTCYVYVDEAEIFPNQKILRWTCPEGHNSYIEDFSI